jgi:putative FmdB family regulatory protein
MPIYEYECTKCGHQAEVWQKFSDSPIARCDLCHSKMKKLISQSSFHLKGTGWYVTDYASKSGVKSGGDQGKSAKSEGQTSSAKSEGQTSSTKSEGATETSKTSPSAGE